MKTAKMRLFGGNAWVILLSTLIWFCVSSCSKDSKPEENPGNVTVPTEYTFTITDFDDGWTSVAKEDWVEVTKGTMKVLIHYPKEGTIIPADPEPHIVNAWNILVAPRYSNIKNFKIAPIISDWIRAYFASANLTDSAGKEVYVALFRKGDTGWIEFVAPDKNAFVTQFGIDINTITYNSDLNTYNPLVKMAGYNKFAVAAADLPGKWSNNFSSNTFYVNIYTGMDAGMSTYASTITYIFGSKTYDWDLVATNSYGGQTSFVHAASSGSYSVTNNWQIYLSDIEGKPKTYNAYFSCIKGARFLWLEDAEYPTGYTSHGRVN
jgi:hypothetical protein